MACYQLDCVVQVGIRFSVAECLESYTTGRFGIDAENWEQWWDEQGRYWKTRQYVAITDVTNNWKLKMQDIIWEIDGHEIHAQEDFPVDSGVELTIFRDNQFVKINGPISSVAYQEFFVGTQYGTPVGNNDLVHQLNAASSHR